MDHPVQYYVHVKLIGACLEGYVDGVELDLLVQSLTSVHFASQDDAQLNGVGVLLDCSGSPAALSNAFKWTKRGAMVCVFGCPPVNRPMR